MRFLYFIISLSIIISCDSNKDFEAMIYDSYINAFYEAFVNASFEVPNIIEPEWKVGDTLIYDTDIHLAKYKNDSLFFIKINSGDTLIVSSYLNNTIDLYSSNDTSINGRIYKKRLMEIEPYGRLIFEKKADFYDRFLISKSAIIDTLLIKYSLTEKEFYYILAKENHRRTGQDHMIIR